AALARWTEGARRGCAAGPIPRLALGGDAATDDGRDSQILFRDVRLTLADGGGARCSAARGGDEGLGWAWLLRARPQSACLRHRDRGGAWRPLPRDQRAFARAPWYWRLHGRRDCGDRLRRTGT